MGVVASFRRLPSISPGSADFGEFFEHFICLEIKTWIDYRKPRTLKKRAWNAVNVQEVKIFGHGTEYSKRLKDEGRKKRRRGEECQPRTGWLNEGAVHG
jgi:hypothetical protein